VRMARVPEEESRKWCGHSCWPMYHDVNNNNNNKKPSPTTLLSLGCKHNELEPGQTVNDVYQPGHPPCSRLAGLQTQHIQYPLALSRSPQ
jgi:hypothetical protein